MDCLRCRGLMVEERFEDLRGDPHHVSFYGWRCVCCGNVTDPVIASNRLRPAVTVPDEAVRNWDLGIRAA